MKFGRLIVFVSRLDIRNIFNDFITFMTLYAECELNFKSNYWMAIEVKFDFYGL